MLPSKVAHEAWDCKEGSICKTWLFSVTTVCLFEAQNPGRSSVLGWDEDGEYLHETSLDETPPFIQKERRALILLLDWLS